MMWQLAKCDTQHPGMHLIYSIYLLCHRIHVIFWHKEISHSSGYYVTIVWTLQVAVWLGQQSWIIVSTGNWVNEKWKCRGSQIGRKGRGKDPNLSIMNSLSWATAIMIWSGFSFYQSGNRKGSVMAYCYQEEMQQKSSTHIITASWILCATDIMYRHKKLTMLNLRKICLMC